MHFQVKEIEYEPCGPPFTELSACGRVNLLISMPTIFPNTKVLACFDRLPDDVVNRHFKGDKKLERPRGGKSPVYQGYKHESGPYKLSRKPNVCLQLVPSD